MIADNLNMKRITNIAEIEDGKFLTSPVAWSVEITCTIHDRPKIVEFLDQWFTKDTYFTVQIPENSRRRHERERRDLLEKELARLNEERARLQELMKQIA
jgi:hypothetical protein